MAAGWAAAGTALAVLTLATGARRFADARLPYPGAVTDLVGTLGFFTATLAGAVTLGALVYVVITAAPDDRGVIDAAAFRVVAHAGEPQRTHGGDLLLALELEAAEAEWMIHPAEIEMDVKPRAQLIGSDEFAHASPDALQHGNLMRRSPIRLRRRRRRKRANRARRVELSPFF